MFELYPIFRQFPKHTLALSPYFHNHSAHTPPRPLFIVYCANRSHITTPPRPRALAPSIPPPRVFCCTALVKLFRRYRAETVDRMETLADENEWLRVVLKCGGDTRDSGELPPFNGGATVNDTQGVTVWYSWSHIICWPVACRPSCRYCCLAFLSVFTRMCRCPHVVSANPTSFLCFRLCLHLLLDGSRRGRHTPHHVNGAPHCTSTHSHLPKHTHDPTITPSASTQPRRHSVWRCPSAPDSRRWNVRGTACMGLRDRR